MAESDGGNEWLVASGCQDLTSRINRVSRVGGCKGRGRGRRERQMRALNQSVEGGNEAQSDGGNEWLEASGC